jgi:hypothetical protein
MGSLRHDFATQSELLCFAMQLVGDRLHALLDGLALHAVMRPERVPPSRVTAVIARHLDTLLRGCC